jgi:hypothetical protein
LSHSVVDAFFRATSGCYSLLQAVIFLDKAGRRRLFSEEGLAKAAENAA